MRLRKVETLRDGVVVLSKLSGAHFSADHDIAVGICNARFDQSDRQRIGGRAVVVVDNRKRLWSVEGESHKFLCGSGAGCR